MTVLFFYIDNNSVITYSTVMLSIAEVASSKRMIYASDSQSLPNVRRCFSPPERITPCSSNLVSNPLLNHSNSLTFSNIVINSLSETYFPKVRFSLNVPSKIGDSCGT